MRALPVQTSPAAPALRFNRNRQLAKASTRKDSWIAAISQFSGEPAAFHSALDCPENAARRSALLGRESSHREIKVIPFQKVMSTCFQPRSANASVFLLVN